MVSKPREMQETHRALDAVTQRYLGLKLVSVGGLPRDEAIPACIKKQVPFYLVRGSSVAARQLDALANHFLRGIQLRTPQGPEGFFARLVESMR